MHARRQGAGNRDQLVGARARLVVGADGRKSQVARLAGARAYNVVPPLYFAFYSYFRGVEPWERGSYLDVYQALEDGGTAMACPADDGIWMLVVYLPQVALDGFRRDKDANFQRRLGQEPALGHRLRLAERIAPVRGAADMENFFRVSWGPGWALVGDSGKFLDPIVGQGMGDACASAVFLADAVDSALRGDQHLEAALAEYHAQRDYLLLPTYERVTRGRPPGLSVEEYSAFLLAVSHDQELSDAYVSTSPYAMLPRDFFCARAHARHPRRPAPRR